MSDRVEGNPNGSGRTERSVIVYLAVMSAPLALSIDTSLPAFDEIREHFGKGEDASVTLIVTTYLVGLALGQLVYGPFSDRFGRGPALRVGLVVYGLAAAGATFATSLEMLYIFRFVWGLGAAAPSVLRAAIARDLYRGDAMARLMSIVMAVFLLVPLVAPALGELLVRTGGWRWTFAMPAMLVLVLMVWSIAFGETLDPANRRPLAIRPTLQAFRVVLTTRETLGYALATMSIFGAFYIFLGSSQPIFEDIYDRGDQFPIFFAGTSAAVGLTLWRGSGLVNRFGARRVAIGATSLTLVAATGQLVTALAGDGVPSVWPWFGLFVIMNAGVVLATPSLTSLALEPMGDKAGTAAAVVGMMQMGGAAGLAAIFDAQIDNTVTPVAVGYLLYCAMGLIFMALAVERRSPERGARPQEPAAPVRPSRS